MSRAQLMDGAGLARRLVEETAKRAADLTARTGMAPCLATVLVGEDPASVTYVRMKQNRRRKAGIESRHVALPAGTTTAELVDTRKALSGDPTVHGILLQHPVGPHIDERAAFEAIAPQKHVDGVTLMPGGVDPMTIAVRLEQTVTGAERQLRRRVPPPQCRSRPDDAPFDQPALTFGARPACKSILDDSSTRFRITDK